MPRPVERLFDHHAFSYSIIRVLLDELTVVCDVWIGGSHARRKAHSISIQRLRVISPLVTCHYLMIAIKTERKINCFRFGILCGAHFAI